MQELAAPTPQHNSDLEGLRELLAPYITSYGHVAEIGCFGGDASQDERYYQTPRLLQIAGYPDAPTTYDGYEVAISPSYCLSSRIVNVHTASIFTPHWWQTTRIDERYTAVVMLPGLIERAWAVNWKYTTERLLRDAKALLVPGGTLVYVERNIAYGGPIHTGFIERELWRAGLDHRHLDGVGWLSESRSWLEPLERRVRRLLCSSPAGARWIVATAHRPFPRSFAEIARERAEVPDPVPAGGPHAT